MKEFVASLGTLAFVVLVVLILMVFDQIPQYVLTQNKFKLLLAEELQSSALGSTARHSSQTAPT